MGVLINIGGLTHAAARQRRQDGRHVSRVRLHRLQLSEEEVHQATIRISMRHSVMAWEDADAVLLKEVVR
jgi:hypothetical protein